MNARMSAVEFGRGTEFTLDLEGSIPETPPEVNTGPNGCLYGAIRVLGGFRQRDGRNHLIRRVMGVRSRNNEINRSARDSGPRTRGRSFLLADFVS